MKKVEDVQEVQDANEVEQVTNKQIVEYKKKLKSHVELLELQWKEIALNIQIIEGRKRLAELTQAPKPQLTKVEDSNEDTNQDGQ